jgi:GT2 family glycosyltransferase
MMGLWKRFNRLVGEFGFGPATKLAWSWLRWKTAGSAIPRAPASPGDWNMVHSALRPPNPNPQTVFSLVVPVYDTPHHLLRETVASVIDQTHTAWELILVDDASPAPRMDEILREVGSMDERIKVIRRASNGGISAATNTGIEAAIGDYVAFLDHDDLLVRTALEWVSVSTPTADLVYTDEAKVDVDGNVTDRVLKPSWSPMLLLGYNYVSHFSVVRTQLVRDLGGLAPHASGAQDHDLLLRLSEEMVTVSHIPSVLYLWRQTPNSTADDPAAKPYAEQAGLRAISEAITRRGWNAEAVLGRGIPFKYAVRWLPDPAETPRVKVVIPTRDRVDLLERAVAGVLDRTDHVEVDLVVVDNGSEEPQTHEYLDRLRENPRVIVVRDDDAFNFSRLCNLGSQIGAPSDAIMFLNNDIEVLHRDWLFQMHGWLVDPRIVAVGAELLYEDRETIQHAGVAVGSGHIGWHFSGGLLNQPRLGDPHDSAHEVTAVTAACMLVRTAAFDAVGGFEEILATDFQDVDLCLKLGRDLGGTIMYESMYPLLHQESASRGSLNAGSGYTIHRMLFRWPGLANEIDSYFHPLAEMPSLGDFRSVDTRYDLAAMLAPRVRTSLASPVPGEDAP